jgi:hypothetical protein
MASEDLVRQYIEAVAANDFETMEKLRHSDWHEDWPQSGERVPSHDAYRRIHENFPGGMPRVELTDVAGAEDRWVVTPSMTIQRIAGSGDVWTVEGTNTYPNGEMYHFIQLLRIHDGTIRHSTSYFAAPFAAPAWRASLTVPIEPGQP